jgi:hypothetical protein
VELLGRFNQHDGTGRVVRPPSKDTVHHEPDFRAAPGTRVVLGWSTPLMLG